MTTHDFTSLSNYSGDPRRAEQLRLASGIDLEQITVDVFNGPAGGHGFRKGYWKADYHGVNYRFFDSIPHASELDVQTAKLQDTAALHIAGIMSGYIAGKGGDRQ